MSIHTSYGYYVDLFFLEKNIRTIDRAQILIALQQALSKSNLTFFNEVDKKEFMEKTRSSKEMNRYVKLPSSMLSKIDERTNAKSTLDVLTEDFNKERELVGQGAKLDTSFSLNSIFHDSRYMSCNLIGMNLRLPDGTNRDYTIIKVAANAKLFKASKILAQIGKVTDLTLMTGIILSYIYGTAGVYARAASFSRSEEVCAYYYKGEQKDSHPGNGTCMAFTNPISKIEELYFLNIPEINNYIDTQIMYHYTADDLRELENDRRKWFENYGIDKPEIYTKITDTVNRWIDILEKLKEELGTNRTKEFTELKNLEYLEHRNKLKKFIRDMLIAVSNIPDEVKTNTEEFSKIDEIASDLMDLLIAHGMAYRNLNKESNIVDVYFRVDFK